MLNNRKWKRSRILAFVMVFALACSHLPVILSYGALTAEAVELEAGSTATDTPAPSDEIIIIDEPEFIKVYEPPEVLPDPNAPDSPERAATLKDGKFRAYVKIYDPEMGEYRYIPEGESPLGELPKTGDTSYGWLWAALCLFSAGSVAALTKFRKAVFPAVRSVGTIELRSYTAPR